MRTVHAWDAPSLTVIEIYPNLRKKLKSRILKRFPSISKAAEFYKTKLHANINTMKRTLRLLLNCKDCSISFEFLCKIAKDNKISRIEVEKSLIRVRGGVIKCESFNSKYPITIKNIASDAKLEKFHSWDLPELQVKKINISFTRDLRNVILHRFHSIENAVKYYTKQIGFSYNWTRALLKWSLLGGSRRKRDNIPLEFLIKVAEDNGFSRQKVEKNIKQIKFKESQHFIINPRFPIKLTPILVSLATHFYGDGCHTQYSQALFHKRNRENFLAKVKNSIGKIPNWSPTAKDFAIPVVVYKTIQHISGISRGHIKRKEFPETILILPKEYKVAMLSTIFVDEGHIGRSQLVLKQKRYHLLKIFYNLCKELDYNTSNIKKEVRRLNYKKFTSYYFYLKIEGMHKFYNDLCELISEYGQFMDLGDKQQTLKQTIDLHLKVGRCKLI